MLRRLKSDVEHTLLPKKETQLYVGMSSMQARIYKSVLKRDIGKRLRLTFYSALSAHFPRVHVHFVRLFNLNGERSPLLKHTLM